MASLLSSSRKAKQPYNIAAIALSLMGTNVLSLEEAPPNILKVILLSIYDNAFGVGKFSRILSRLDLSQVSGTNPESFRAAIGHAAQMARCPPLQPGESTAVAIASPKSAALFVDRVWTLAPSVPSKIEFTCGTNNEEAVRGIVDSMVNSTVMAKFGMARVKAWSEGEIDEEIKRFVDEAGDLLGKHEQQIAPMLEQAACLPVREATNRKISPFMATADSFQALHREGDFQVVSIVLENMKIVDESSLTWEHVLAIREDPNTMKKLRRMTHWLDGALAEKSISYIEDEIGNRVDAYEEGLKLTGVKVREGRMAFLTELRLWSALVALTTGTAGHAVLSGSSTPTVIGTSLVAALSGLTLLGGKLHHECRSIRHAHEEKLEQSEIAYLYEIQRAR